MNQIFSVNKIMQGKPIQQVMHHFRPIKLGPSNSNLKIHHILDPTLHICCVMSVCTLCAFVVPNNQNIMHYNANTMHFNANIMYTMFSCS